jgi:hypothetical protein
MMDTLVLQHAPELSMGALSQQLPFLLIDVFTDVNRLLSTPFLTVILPLWAFTIATGF